MRDDTLTICAISALAAMLGNVLHEGVGHALVALLTGTGTGTLSTVAWSSAHDTRLVAAGGTLVNIAAGIALWVVLRRATGASARVKFFLLIASAFNLLSGTGYFLFSGVTNFGDWADVTAGLKPAWAWRTLLIVVGVVAYFGALRLVGRGLGGQPAQRIRGLMIPAYVTAVALACVAALFSPFGRQLMWQSALPSTAGANAGLVWMQYYVPRGVEPGQSEAITRSPGWIAAAVVAALVFTLVLGRGVAL
jgi:hypothetical protein